MFRSLKRLGRRRSLRRGILAGLAGGLAGTVAMTQFQNGWNKLSQSSSNGSGSQSDKSERSDPEKEDATMKAAGKLAEAAGYSLPHQTKKKAGPLVHYTFGTAMGLLYGIAAEMGPRAVKRHSLLSGLGFGGAVFVLGDEIAVPRLGLSAPAREAPLSSHLYGAASHLVYGATTGVVRQAVARLL